MMPSRGDTFTIERGILHSLQAEEDTILLEVQIEEKKIAEKSGG